MQIFLRSSVGEKNVGHFALLGLMYDAFKNAFISPAVSMLHGMGRKEFKNALSALSLL